MWHNRSFVSGLVSSLCNFVALIAVSFMLPFYLEDIPHFTALQVGFLLTPVPIAIALVSPFSGVLADRRGTRRLAAMGLGVSSLGLTGIALLQACSPVWH